MNLVIGFRPELWRAVAAHDAPAGLTGFNEPLAGSEGFWMPATQADLFVWNRRGFVRRRFRYRSEQKIFRRNTAYGNAVAHGTGFSQDRDRLELMLRRIAGADDGIRDALTRYATPLSGAFYFCPSLRALQSFAPPKVRPCMLATKRT